MADVTRQIAERSLFISVIDNQSGKIRRVAVPADFQVGTTATPAELQLYGQLSLHAVDYVITNRTPSGIASGGCSINIDNDVTIASINIEATSPFSVVEIHLPTSPRDGQIIFVKDGLGNASAVPFSIYGGLSNHLIDGTLYIELDLSYGGVLLYWYAGSWHTLITNLTASGGGGAPTNATYLTLTSNGSLTNERTLAVNPNLVMTDGGANSTLSLNLSAILGLGAGSFTNPIITVDTYGRITSISSGTAPITDVGADKNATYVLFSSTGSLANRRILSAGHGIGITDGGAGGNLVISNLGVLTGSGASSATVSIPYQGFTTGSFVVPIGVTSIDVKMWGAGGGTGNYLPPSQGAGAGGFTSGTINVTPGEILYYIIGGGGAGTSGSSANGGNGGYGGGGNGSRGDASGGGGGGFTGIFSGSTPTQGNAIMIAGAGGGGTGFKGGGGGGGLTGSSGYNVGSTPGFGGTQALGGASGVVTTPPFAGSALRGGIAVGSQTVSSPNDGGGGGGGWFGGGGGGQSDGSGGGGGSGYYLTGTKTSGVITHTGAASAPAFAGLKMAPPFVSDPDYVSFAPANTGKGGAAVAGNGEDGGHGFILLKYTSLNSVVPWLPLSNNIAIVAGRQAVYTNVFEDVGALEFNLSGANSMVASGSIGYSAYFQPIVEVTPIGAVAEVRLYNVTTNTVVLNSLLSTSGLIPTALKTSNLSGSLTSSGLNVYTMQMRLQSASPGFSAICKGAKLFVTWI